MQTSSFFRISKDCRQQLFIRRLRRQQRGRFARLSPWFKAIEELRIESPLREAKLSKKDILELSKELGLSTWNKPSFACLASRFVYGERITERRLKMISSTEQFLFQIGFKQYRVRIHGSDGNELARIEVLPEDFEKLFQHKAAILRECKQAGFAYVSLDVEGFRSGSMNVGK